jgi:hypothetical protein
MMKADQIGTVRAYLLDRSGFDLTFRISALSFEIIQFQNPPVLMSQACWRPGLVEGGESF